MFGDGAARRADGYAEAVRGGGIGSAGPGDAGRRSAPGRGDARIAGHPPGERVGRGTGDGGARRGRGRQLGGCRRDGVGHRLSERHYAARLPPRVINSGYTPIPNGRLRSQWAAGTWRSVRGRLRPGLAVGRDVGGAQGPEPVARPGAPPTGSCSPGPSSASPRSRWVRAVAAVVERVRRRLPVGDRDGDAEPTARRAGRAETPRPDLRPHHARPHLLTISGRRTERSEGERSCPWPSEAGT